MQQWLGLDPLAAFALRRIQTRGWHVSAHFINDTVEFHAMRGAPPEFHMARCQDGDELDHQFRAAKLLAEAVGVRDVVPRIRQSGSQR
jgi:hypothetical protein